MRIEARFDVPSITVDETTLTPSKPGPFIDLSTLTRSLTHSLNINEQKPIIPLITHSLQHGPLEPLIPPHILHHLPRAENPRILRRQISQQALPDHIIDDDQGAGAAQLRRPVDVRPVVLLVGVDEDQIEALALPRHQHLGLEGREAVQRRADVDFGSVGGGGGGG